MRLLTLPLKLCTQASVGFSLYTVYIDDNIPRIHNIISVIERFEDKLPEPVSEEYRQLFDKLSAFYLNNRYPDFISKLSIQIKETEAKEILTETKEAFAWLLTLKP